VKLSVPFRIGLLGTIAVEAAMVFYAWRTGVILFPAFGFVLIPLLIWFQTGIGWLLNWFRVSGRRVCQVQIGFWIFAVAGIVFCGWVEGTPRGAFRRLVMDPIPSSVQVKEWNGMVGLEGFYTFYFEADPDDMAKVINGLHLIRIMDSAWFSPPSPSRLLITNLILAPSENYFHWKLSNHCAWVKVPFTKLDGPEVCGLSNSEGKMKDRWVGTLLMDREHRKAFYVLN